MEKSMHKTQFDDLTKSLQSFRARQKKAMQSNEPSKEQQYRELQDILSPFLGRPGRGSYRA